MVPCGVLDDGARFARAAPEVGVSTALKFEGRGRSTCMVKRRLRRGIDEWFSHLRNWYRGDGSHYQSFELWCCAAIRWREIDVFRHGSVIDLREVEDRGN